MSYTEHAPKSYVDSKLALKADVMALRAVSAIATALDTRLSQLARDTYTKTQIDYLTEAIKKGRFKKVDSLPEIEEAELYVIYLVPRSDPESQNVKDEYIVIVGDGDARSWEKVGSTDVDLSGYATLDDLTSATSAILGNIDNLRDYATGAINNITGVEIPRLEGGISSAASEASSAMSTANSVAAYAAQIESKADQNASDISDLSDEVDDRVLTSRTVNGQPLTGNVELDADDVGAYPATDVGEGEYESDKDLYVNGQTRGEHVQARSPSDGTDWCDVATLLHIADEFDPQEQYAKDALVTFRENENWKLYKCVAANGHTGNWNPNDFQEATVEDILADVVHKTGDETIAGNKTFQDITAFQDEVLIESGSLVVGTVGVDNTNFYAGGIRTYGHQAPIQYPAYNGLGNDFFALIQHIAPDYDGETSHTYAVNELRAYQGAVYRCMTAHTATSWVAANWATATVEDVLAALRTAIAGKADVSAIPYALVTKTVSNGVVTLDDRATNAVECSATLSPNTLAIDFPTNTSGKVRDFAMRLNIAAGVTAPEIAWPLGVTLENDGGEVPEITDGGTGGSSTILYFSETENNGTTAKFLVKGETLTAIAH